MACCAGGGQTGKASEWQTGCGEVERRYAMNEHFEYTRDVEVDIDSTQISSISEHQSSHLPASAGIPKRIAMVAHDNKKDDLLAWARYNRELLVQHELYATGTTGRLLRENLDAPVTSLQSGPLGGDQQIGARIAEGGIDLLIFFWDPLSPQPHDTDVKALLRIAVVWNIPVACDRATADYVISSPLMTEAYERQLPDYAGHSQRFVPEQGGLIIAGDS
ncbi:MAG TPA: methylglyoxal synthase [Anaerolineales bacterium]